MNSTQTECGMLNIDSDILTKAWDGDAVAQLKLGKAYFSAVYNENNCIHAFQWLTRSAEQDNMEAQFRLGDLYALGQGTKKSFMDAYEWYTKAALQGYKKALIRIHNLYQEDKKMRCRGQLNSDEEEWASEEFKKKNSIRELNEFRLQQYAGILNHAADYYMDQFQFYKTSDHDDAIEFYRMAAEQGHRDAQYNLGYLYQHTTTIKFNYRLALRWYRVSATGGNIAAQNCLGYFYEKGLVTDLNYEGALYWYARAANSGWSSAQLTLGRLYRKGRGVEKNTSEAVKWYKLASSQGNIAAQNCLNQLYLEKKSLETVNKTTVLGHNIDLPAAFTLRDKLQNDINRLYELPQFKQLKILAHHALRTDRNAMFNVGLKYYNGEDLPQDRDTGFQWIKKAGRSGLLEAELKIAKLYEKGNTVNQDYHQSAVWTKKSVKKRNIIAQQNLGLLYKKGLGVRKDPLEASKWFVKSSDQGNGDAQYQFGLLKYYGEGLRQDDESAFEWFRLAILYGNTDALYEVAKTLEKEETRHRVLETREREFVIVVTNRYRKTRRLIITWEESESLAFLMYNLAGQFDHKRAQFRLGEIYEEGKQVKYDREKAREFYFMAADSDDTFYQTELAIKYINGDFSDTDYIKAFELLKKAAEEKDPRATGIFETPMKWIGIIKDPSSVIDMFISASSRGVEGVDYNLGYLYEYGVILNEKKVFAVNYAKSIQWYSEAAEKGDSRAQYRLGAIYEEGKGVDEDIQTAIKYYRQAYENGNCDAAYSLGLMYLNGSGVSQDFITSFYLFTEASDMGHKNAYKKLRPSYEGNILAMLEAAANLGYVAIQYQLGIFYEHKDDLKSFKWLSLAIQGKISDAYYRLGVLYEEGRGTGLNYSKAIDFYKQAISQDHEDSMYRLGHMYHYGVGTELDYANAYKLYNRAAESGHLLSLKVLNIAGDQNPKSYSKAREKSSNSNFGNKYSSDSFPSTSDEFNYSIIIYKYVAEQGDIEAQYTLVSSYEYTFKRPDYREAAKWYSMAAKNLHGKAMYHLGLLYERGLGVVQDYQKAYQLYEDAYKQGNYDALYKLAVAYQSGSGVNTDLDKAIQYYTEAANYGHVDAQYNLGILYEQGELVERNILLALKWYTTAYLQGNDEASQELYSMYLELPLQYYFYEKLHDILKAALRPIFRDIHRSWHDAGNERYGCQFYMLGYLYLYGLGTYQDYPEAWEFITGSVRKLNFKDKYGLLELDSVEKVEMETKAADDGDEYARYSIGKYHYVQATQERIRLQGQTSTAVINNITESYDDGPISHHYKKAIHYFSLTAADGHSDSQFHLGKIYENGYGTTKDYEQAKAWYIEASGRKHRGARHSLGMLYLNEKTDEINYPEALLQLSIAEKEGNKDSLFQLGWMYEHGIGVLEDRKESDYRFHVYLEAMQTMSTTNYDIKDSNNLSDNTANQDNDQDLETYHVNKLDGLAFTELQELSDKGYAEASYILSRKYFDKTGSSKFIDYIRKAAHQGHSVSQEELALSYYYGINAVKDIRIAAMWFRAAAKNEEVISMLYLGQIFHCGLLDAHDFSGAFKLYKEVDGIYRAITLHGIGLLYEYGDGFKTNYDFALRYYNESLTEGNNISGYNIALMYFHGKGVKQDYKESAYWLEKALQKSVFQNLSYVFVEVEHNLAAAIETQSKRKYSVICYDQFLGEINYLLGRIYYEGLSIQQDTDKSYGYFSAAEKKGKNEARIQLNEIEGVRRQMKKIEDEKRAIKKAKLRLERTIHVANVKLKLIEEAYRELKEIESSGIQSSQIKEAKSLPIQEIESFKEPLRKEIEDAIKLLDVFEAVEPGTKKEFEDAKLRLTEIINKAEPHLDIIEKAKSVLNNIKVGRLQLAEKIQEAEALPGKIEEAQEQLKKIRDSKLQCSKIDKAKSLCEDYPKKVLGQLQNPIEMAKKILEETDEIDSVSDKIETAKNQLQFSIKNITEWLDNIAEARIELRDIEWKQKRKLLNNS